MFKKILFAILAALMLSTIPVSMSSASTYYLGNPRSMKFHYPDCRTIKHPERFVVIDSRDEAVAEGYVPCGVCNP